MPVIYLTADKNIAAGKYTINATLEFQACNESVCLPPVTKEFSLPLTIVGEKGHRGTVAGYKDW